MKYVIYGLIIIYVVVISHIIAVCTTIIINDYLWQQRIIKLEVNHQNEIEKIEYKIFSSVHRSCMAAVEDNNICNLSGRNIYQLYQKNWKPLPGFDFDLIAEEEKENTY